MSLAVHYMVRAFIKQMEKAGLAAFMAFENRHANITISKAAVSSKAMLYKTNKIIIFAAILTSHIPEMCRSYLKAM